MEKPKKPPKLVISWKAVEDPYPDALAKAFRLLFSNKRPTDPTGFDKNRERANVQEQSKANH
jgi:hypothetical protein